MLISPTQDKLYYAVQLCFQHGEKVSNNITEYEGLIAGLKVAAALGVKRLTNKGDSQLLVNFTNKMYEPKDEHMEAYLAKVRKMENSSRALSCSTCPGAPTRKPRTSPGEHPSGNHKSLVSLTSDSSSHQLRHLFQARLSLGRSSQSLRPREPRPGARPQELGCSWRSSPRRSAGPRNSRST